MQRTNAKRGMSVSMRGRVMMRSVPTMKVNVQMPHMIMSMFVCVNPSAECSSQAPEANGEQHDPDEALAE